jgi:hypothetical protein
LYKSSHTVAEYGLLQSFIVCCHNHTTTTINNTKTNTKNNNNHRIHSRNEITTSNNTKNDNSTILSPLYIAAQHGHVYIICFVIYSTTKS